MTVYLGNSEKLNIVVGGSFYKMNMFTRTQSDVKNGRLMSSDGYILKDINGVYLTAKEDE